MDVTVYLPDEIGRRAKEEQLPLSQLLRAAVVGHFAEVDALAGLAPHMKVIKLNVEVDGINAVARFNGLELAENLYLHEDDRVLWYDESNQHLNEVEDPAEELRESLSLSEYTQVLHRLGMKPVLDF